MQEHFKAGVYRHYKGQHYLALGLAREDETDETVVVYTRLYAREGLPMSTRRLSVWNEQVQTPDGPVPRFAYVGHSAPLP
ncbi:MAG: DUF1653 domain-containing protein [Pseudomonadota bacterium]